MRARGRGRGLAPRRDPDELDAPRRSWSIPRSRPSSCCSACSTRTACAPTRSGRSRRNAAARASGSRPCCARSTADEIADMRSTARSLVTCEFCSAVYAFAERRDRRAGGLSGDRLKSTLTRAVSHRPSPRREIESMKALPLASRVRPRRRCSASPRCSNAADAADLSRSALHRPSRRSGSTSRRSRSQTTYQPPFKRPMSITNFRSAAARARELGARPAASPVGRDGRAVFTIRDASVDRDRAAARREASPAPSPTEPAQRYDMRLEATRADPRRAAATRAPRRCTVTRSQSVLEGITPNERDQAWYEHDQGALMADFDRQMESEIRNNFGNFVRAG